MASGSPSSRRTISATTASSSGPGSKPGRHRPGPLDEQLHGRSVVAGRRRRRQRRHRAQLLAGDPQALAARGHDPHLRAPRRAAAPPARRPDRGRARSCRASRTSSVSPSTSATRSVSPTPGRPSIASAAATTSTADSVAGRGQLAQHDRPVGPRRAQALTDLDEQPGLAHPARADQRDQAAGVDHRRHLGHERVPADQRRDGDGAAGSAGVQRVAARCRRAGRRAGRPGRRRLDAELVAEQPAEVVVDAQRLDCAARRRQGGHQQRPGPLPQRLLVDERGQLGDQAVGVPRRPAGARPVASRARVRSSPRRADSARPSSTSSSSG